MQAFLNTCGDKTSPTKIVSDACWISEEQAVAPDVCWSSVDLAVAPDACWGSEEQAVVDACRDRSGSPAVALNAGGEVSRLQAVVVATCGDRIERQAVVSDT